MLELVLSFFTCFNVCGPAKHTWIYFLALFLLPFTFYTLVGQEYVFVIFAIHSLYSCEQGLYFFVIFVIHSLYSCGPGVFFYDFVLLPFTVYTLLSQEFFFLVIFLMNSLGLYSVAYLSICLLREREVKTQITLEGGE